MKRSFQEGLWFLGTVASMRCTSFPSRLYSSRDLNMGANGSAWPAYNHEKTLISGHSYNVFLPMLTKDQFLVHDKEILRQTMLKHESIFRDQVRELHHLYRRQRELMDEIKRRELSKQNIQLQTSQSISFSPKVSSKSVQKSWQVSSSPWVNPAATRLSISSAENIQSISIFSLWESTQASPNIAQTEANLKDCKLSHSKSEKPKRKMLDLELPADEYIDSEEEEDRLGEEEVSKLPELPCYPPKRMPEVSRRTTDLADLNEPIYLDDAMASNTENNFLGSETYHKGIPCQDHELSGKSNSGFQQFSKEISGQSVSNLNPQAQVFSSAKLPVPFKQLKVELPAEFSEFNLSDECERKLQNQKTDSVRETSKRNHDLCNDDYQQLASSSLPVSYQPIPQSGLAKSEPSSVSSQRKLTRNIRQNPIAVQALPCFNIAVPSNRNTKSLRLNHSSGRDVKCAKTMDLNIPPSCLLDSEVSQQSIATGDGVKKHEDSRAVLPGPSEKPDYNNKHEERGDLPPADLVFSQAFSTSVCDADEPMKFTTSDSPGNEKDCKSNQKVEIHDINSGKQCTTDNVSEDIIVDSKLLRIGNQIDLNLCVNEDESSPELSIPSVITTATAEIDLEAPGSPENKECSPPRGESEENQHETPIKLSKQDRDQKDELIRMAAKAIVLISTHGPQKLFPENTSCSDSLHWFAGIVSSLADDLENQDRVVLSGEDGGEHHEFSSDGSDYFETMTIELNETNWCKRNDLKEKCEGEMGRRNASSRARKQASNSFCHGMEKTVSLKSWGKINRRRRGPRIPASNARVLLS